MNSETMHRNEKQQAQFDRFFIVLKSQYTHRFETDPAFAHVASRTTPEDLARKMTCGLAAGSANKDGAAVKATCAALGIKHTYKAIREFLG